MRYLFEKEKIKGQTLWWLLLSKISDNLDKIKCQNVDVAMN